MKTYFPLLIGLFCLLKWTPVPAQAPVFSLTFDSDPDSTEAVEQISSTPFDITNPFDRPERIAGPIGQALRLDGYATWASNLSYTLPGITDELSLEAWYSTECFNEQPVGLISQQNSNSGFSLNVSSFGNVILEFYTDNRFYSVRTIEQLSRYTWHHIAATIDLNNQEAKIYIDGNLSQTQALNSASQIELASARMYVGRNFESPTFAGLLLTVANGALDEVNVYDEVLNAGFVQTQAQQGAGVEADLFIDPDVRHAGDYLRPRYHAMPNTTWTNEAYGLTYFDSTYHLFFQKNPNAPSLYFMHWGHFTSRDLVEWKEEKMPLWPIEGFADFGVWSGTTFFHEGEPVIAYTGVNGQFAGMGLAYPDDSSLITWTRDPNNPVIPGPPTAVPNLDFRDPYVWKVDSTYYMVVGSGRAGNNGGLLFTYRSTNLVNWINQRPLYERTDIGETGYFWEMPFFAPLNETDWLLAVTPVYDGKNARVLYWIGSWDPGNNAFEPYHTEPKAFVHLSSQLLAPAIGQDANGDLSYIGIIPEDRNVNDQIAAGWRQTFSVPRVLRQLEDGNLGHIPHPNLCRLRQNGQEITDRTFVPNSNFNLPEFSGTQVEMEAILVPEAGSEFSLQVFKNAGATEFTSITFDLDQNRLGIDRRFSSPYQTLENNRWAEYFFGDTIRVRAFLDHSVLEVFVDNLAVMSARVYPSEQSDLFDLVVPEGEVTASRISVWELQNKEEVLGDTTCSPGLLPDRFLTHVETLEEIPGLRVFPNPASESLTIAWKVPAQPMGTTASFYAPNGQLMQQQALAWGPNEVDIQGWASGLYLLRIDTPDQQTLTHKILVR